jgi:hypothetical protein
VSRIFYTIKRSKAKLPVNTPEAIASNTSIIEKLVIDEIAKSKPASYLLVSNVLPGLVEDAVDHPYLLGSKNIHVCYNCSTRQLIVKLPRKLQEVAAPNSGHVLQTAFGKMGLEDRIVSHGAGLVQSLHVMKEPDGPRAPVTECLPNSRNPN